MNVIGHRGASAHEDENTPAAFATADRMGADGVELDVRLDDRAGRLVVFHDPLPEDRDSLPSFEEILDACGDRMLINVEIKNSAEDGGHDASLAVVDATLDTMRRRGPNWSHRWLVSSFDFATIERSHAIAPDVPTAWLVYAIDDDTMRRCVDGGHSALHPYVLGLDAETVEKCHAAGLAVNVWTCNDAERIAELDRDGVDGVCTDVIDTALRALGRSNAGVSDVRWGTPT